MTVALATTQDQERVEAAVKAAGENGGRDYEVRLGLYADDTDLSATFEKGEWGQSDIPITLDATVSGYLPRRLQDAPIRLVTEIDGVLIDQLRGEKSTTVPGEDPYVTDLLSSSAGALLNGEDAISLGDFTEYRGLTPEAIAYDAVRRAPYNPALINISPIPGVALTWAGSGESPGLLAHEPTGAVLSRLADTKGIGYRYRDTVQGGFVAWVPTPLANPVGKQKTYRPSTLPDWLKQRPTPPTTRFAAVRVYCQGPDGKTLYEAVEEVPYTSTTRRPHPGRIKHIPIEDYSAEGPSNARKQAVREALEIARGLSTGEMLLPAYDPLIEPNDTYCVAEDHRDTDDNSWQLLWYMRVEAYKHLYGEQSTEEAGLLATQVQYTSALILEDRIKAPTFIVPGYTTGVALTPTSFGDAYGIDGDTIYFTDSLAWVAADGDTLIFNDSAPTLASASGDEIVVSK